MITNHIGTNSFQGLRRASLCSIAASLLVFSLAGCGLPDGLSGDSRAQAEGEETTEPTAPTASDDNGGAADPLLPPSTDASRSVALVTDALHPGNDNEAPPASETFAAERERLEAERAAQEQREAELAQRERELAEREQRLAQQRAAEREAAQEQERAAAAERERQRAAEERRQQAQAAELERARQAERQAAADVTAGTTGNARSERAGVVDEPSEVATTADTGPSHPDHPAEPALHPPTAPPEWTGNEAWRDGRAEDGTSGQSETGEPTEPSERATARDTAQRLSPGTRFEVEITETVSSASSQVGDPVTTRLSQDIIDQRGNLLVAAGTELRGRVTEVRPLRKVGGRAALGVVIDRIVLPGGDQIEIRASLQQLGKDKRSDKFRIAGAAVAGAILGGIFGDAEGAVAGAAAGAAAGTAAVARAKGEDVELPAGMTLELELEGIVTVHEEIGGVVPR